MGLGVSEYRESGNNNGCERYFGVDNAVKMGRSRSASGRAMERQIKVIVEKHPEGYVAYPLGVKGVVVGQGESYREALEDVQSAIAFHVETFGPEAIVDGETPIVEVFVAEASMAG